MGEKRLEDIVLNESDFATAAYVGLTALSMNPAVPQNAREAADIILNSAPEAVKKRGLAALLEGLAGLVKA